MWRTAWVPTRVPTLSAVDVEDRHHAEAVVGEDVRGGDRLAEVARAEQGDVVLAGRAQDLADLRDERLDVVADAALAELAEAGEVAADLGRVDVRVVGELLRGDRLLAHLLGLREHLQVARQPRRDAQRQPLRAGGGPRMGLHRRPGSDSPKLIGVTLDARAGAAHRRSIRTAPRRRARPPGCARSRHAAAARRPSMSSSCRSNPSSSLQPLAGASPPPRTDGSRAVSTRSRCSRAAVPRSRRRRGRGSPDMAAGSAKRAALAIIAALSVHSSRGGTWTSAPSARRRPRSSPLAATPPPTARRSSPSARAPRSSRSSRLSTIAAW